MLRPGAALVIVPKSALVTVLATFKKFALLKRLTRSAWNGSRHASVSANRLRSDKSHNCKLGPRTLRTPAVPRRDSGAGAKAAVLNQRLTVRSSLDSSISPPRKSAPRAPMAERPGQGQYVVSGLV